MENFLCVLNLMDLADFETKTDYFLQISFKDIHTMFTCLIFVIILGSLNVVCEDPKTMKEYKILKGNGAVLLLCALIVTEDCKRSTKFRHRGILKYPQAISIFSVLRP
uniref:Uncharacterized protein n=1 Tax=Trichobilharzia regenti TaxID=157069 RepID=A0AA85JE86_TRIRE|nr:unnamed protein product [Trichobilharzia regenti]